MKSKVVFVVSQFPCYDEAFILREIYALSKKMEVLIFSLKSSKDKIIHDQASRLLPKVVYVPFVISDLIFWSHLQIFFTHPVRYLLALSSVIRGNIRSPEFLIKSLAFFPKAIYLAKLIEKEKITHIHAYWATYPASVALVASEITGIPFSFTGHAHDIYLDTTHLKEKMMRAAFVTTCTQQNREHLKKVAPLYSEHRILVNYHGLELDHFFVNGKARNSTFEILSVGTLQYHKGFQYLLPALGFLKDKALNFRCTIIGGGPLESDLRKHVRLLGLESYVLMTGPLKQEEVLPFYKKADLLVLMAQPEWHWGIPNVLVEALAAKTPVITTRFGSVEELVKDGETGLIVSPKEPAVLAEAIEKLYQNETLRLRLAESGHRFVAEYFNLDKNIQMFQRMLVHDDTSSLVA